MYSKGILATMKISKAVITSAGFGTRFLPITKTIQKEMLPILNRPLVDYVVEDCIKAGITDIIFIISEHNSQLVHFYRENKRLYEYLKRMNKLDQYESVSHLHTQANYTFIKQDDSETYGTATPVKLAKEQLKDEEAFLVFMGDDFIFNADGSSETKRMIETFTQSNAAGLATCIERPKSILHKYGIAKIKEKNHFTYLSGLVEKPAPGSAPSNLANISKYIFTPAIFEIIEKQTVNPGSGELYITDSITQLAQQAPVVIHTPAGEYLDGGYVLGWLKANLMVARSQPELARELQELITELFPSN